jgi:4-hydroxythreonine-4-phosphate dehydrogenase
MGDPAGVGPEIIAKALGQATVRTSCRPVVVGIRAVIEDAARVCGLTIRLVPLGQVGDDPEAVEIVDLPEVDPRNLPRATVSIEGGRAAYAAIEAATKLALAGKVDAIATAPINKEAINAAGFGAVGHTELLAHLCGVPTGSVAMMLASSRLRVVHVTTHVSMVRAVELLTIERIAAVVRLAVDATRRIVDHEPTVAVAGLNPHAGEHGLFGSEELEVIGPAVAKLRDEGLDVVGPVPPDTVFLSAVQGKFDVVIAMYHDQGHIPSKLIGFDDTVNVTLGLPIIRTSVDHGTAFDIAWTGQANERNMVEALRVAATMAHGPRATN